MIEGPDEPRPLVMGVLNVTPDSFFDGGRYLTSERAISHGLALAGAGADIVDVGGESTRPGAAPVGTEEELRRVVPVLEGLAGHVRLSVDTRNARVARAAALAGATLLNDISGRLWWVAAELGLGWVAMHMQGVPETMQRSPSYVDVVGEVRDHLVDRAGRAREAGVGEIWLDPGIGFGKTTRHNLGLLAGIGQLVAVARELGCGVLVGTSRKRFLGVVAAGGGEPFPVEDRLEGSLATAVWCMAQGVGMVRVHDVTDTVRAAALVGGRGAAAGVGRGGAGPAGPDRASAPDGGSARRRDTGGHEGTSSGRPEEELVG